jgi:hypothetical protein
VRSPCPSTASTTKPTSPSSPSPRSPARTRTSPSWRSRLATVSRRPAACTRDRSSSPPSSVQPRARICGRASRERRRYYGMGRQSTHARAPMFSSTVTRGRPGGGRPRRSPSACGWGLASRSCGSSASVAGSAASASFAPRRPWPSSACRCVGSGPTAARRRAVPSRRATTSAWAFTTTRARPPMRRCRISCRSTRTAETGAR